MNDRDALALEAHQWMERGQWARARHAIRRGLALDPEDLELRYAAARLDYLCDADDAAESARDVLRLEPAHAGARLLLARIATTQGHHAEAERLLLELLREVPDDSHLLCHYALLLLRAGQPGKARSLAVDAARLAPEDLLVLTTLTLLDLAEGRAPQDTAALGELLTLYPEAEATLQMLAVSLADDLQLRAAREAAAVLVRRSPDDEDVIRLAAHIAYVSHWSMRPLYPLLRWGWAASFGLYAGFIGLTTLGRDLLPAPALIALALLWISYAIYSWVVPPLLKRRRFPELT